MVSALHPTETNLDSFLNYTLLGFFPSMSGAAYPKYAHLMSVLGAGVAGVASHIGTILQIISHIPVYSE